MVKILVPLCDMCQEETPDVVEPRAEVEETMTIGGEEYVFDLCRMHHERWYLPLVALVDRVGVKTRLLASRVKSKRRAEPPAVDAVVVEPAPALPPASSATESDAAPEPMPSEPVFDEERTCPFPGCGSTLASRERRNVHMRENHTDWYYSDAAKPYRAKGKLGEVHHCEICGTPKVGLQGLRAHQRQHHPDDYDRIVGEFHEQQERERQQVLA